MSVVDRSLQEAKQQLDKAKAAVVEARAAVERARQPRIADRVVRRVGEVLEASLDRLPRCGVAEHLEHAMKRDRVETPADDLLISTKGWVWVRVYGNGSAVNVDGP